MATRQTRTAVRRPAPSTSSRGAAASSSSLVYVYCIADGPAAPALGRAKGLPDAGRPRALPVAPSRWLVVADVPDRRFGEQGLEEGLRDLEWVGACAIAHDALIMNVMKNGPVVPMRLFTIFESEDRAREQAKAAAKKVARTLRRVAGHAEYGVRIGARPKAVRAAPTGKRAISGRSYLEQKREQLAARRALAIGPAEGDRQRVFDRLAAIADDARERPIPAVGSAVWLDGAFLVPFRNAPVFRREVRRLAGELKSEGHDVVLTGPWPPYSFLDEHASES